MKGRAYTIYVALVVSLGGFLYGFDASVISGVIGYVSVQFELNTFQTGWVVSCTTFAAMFAMLTAGTISTYVGRRSVLIIVALLYAISAIGSAIAPDYYTLVIARMIGGLAFGAALILAPIYIAEIAPAKRRGKLVAIQQLNLVIGLSAAYFSNYGLQIWMESSSFLNEFNVWRWMLGLEAVPALAYFFLLFIVPRSPRWLIMKGKARESLDVLEKIYTTREEGEIEFASIVRNLEESSKKEKTPLKALFAPELKKVLSIGVIIGVVQMITGINAVFYYANTIFEQSGVGKNAAFAQAVMVGIIFIVFTVVAMLVIDRLGRKPLLLIGLAGIIITLSLTVYGFHNATYTLPNDSLGISSKLEPIIGVSFDNDVEFKNKVREIIGDTEFSQNQDRIISSAIKINSRMVLVGILGFIASFAMSLGPVMWVLLSEIFPTRIRGLAISFIGFINSSTSTLVTLIFPWELENLGNVYTFILYIIFALIGLVLLARLLPETKGKSLEELEKQLVN